jgi:hypothetical protein
MKNTRFTALFTALLIAVLSISAYASDQPKVSVSTNKKSYSPGENGVLIIKFRTGPHVKIPKEPAVEVVSIDGVSGGSMLEFSGNGDYIENKTVKYTFTVPADASGSVKITGSLKFGYCSETDGVCKFGKSGFSTNIKIK